VSALTPAATRSGPERVDDVDGDERTRLESQIDVDDPVDLGCLAVAASHAGRVDQHLDRRADQRIATCRGDVVLQFAQFGQSLAHQSEGSTPPSRSAA
jgi:hypothetical protein